MEKSTERSVMHACISGVLFPSPLLIHRILTVHPHI